MGRPSTAWDTPGGGTGPDDDGHRSGRPVIGYGRPPDTPTHGPGPADAVLTDLR